MTRTTLNIDDPILRDLRRMQRQRRQSLGRVASDLLAEAVAHQGEAEGNERPPFEWATQPMAARIDLADKEAVWAALDSEG